MARDWTCRRCTAVNSEAMVGCPSCGLPRDAPIDPPTDDAPPTTPQGRKIPVRFALWAVIAVAALIGGWFVNAGRSSSGEISKSGSLHASDLRAGDCYDLKDPAADTIDEVTARPCTEEHEYEMFFVDSLVSGSYPDQAVFETFVVDNCGPAFASYVGKAYEDSELDVFWFYPEPDAWEGGDRSVQCALYHPRIHRLTASMKDSAR